MCHFHRLPVPIEPCSDTLMSEVSVLDSMRQFSSSSSWCPHAAHEHTTAILDLDTTIRTEFNSDSAVSVTCALGGAALLTCTTV